jgi:putative ABC transport system permease protein
MTELFGIPTDQLTLVLLAVCISAVLACTYLALRDRVAFKVAARNAPRRPTQTALVLVGLMLAAILFSAAFTTQGRRCRQGRAA